MARRKKRKATRRRRTSRRRGVKTDKAMPLGATLGMAGSGLEILTEKMPDGGISVVDAIFYPYDSIGTKINAVANKSKTKLTELNNYKFAVAGALISASPRLPLIGIVARPVNKALKQVSKGKVKL